MFEQILRFDNLSLAVLANVNVFLIKKQSTYEKYKTMDGKMMCSLATLKDF
jgi:hypothetical protein